MQNRRKSKSFQIEIFMCLAGLLMPVAPLSSSNWLVERIKKETKESSKIFTAVVGSGAIYGIIGNQITGRISPEFFTTNFMKINAFKQPDVIKNLLLHENPTIRGCATGIHYSLPWGIPLAIIITAAARLGPLPQLELNDFAQSALKYGVPSMLGIEFLGGGLVYYNTLVNPVISYGPPGTPSGQISKENWLTNERKRSKLVGDMHFGAYAGGVIGSAGLITYILYERYKRAQELQKGSGISSCEAPEESSKKVSDIIDSTIKL